MSDMPIGTCPCRGSDDLCGCQNWPNGQPDPAASLVDRIKALEAALADLLAAYNEPDRQICCNGYHCGCQGSTVRDMAEHYAREELSRRQA
jgi:hypothetical protein